MRPCRGRPRRAAGRTRPEGDTIFFEETARFTTETAAPRPGGCPRAIEKPTTLPPPFTAFLPLFPFGNPDSEATARLRLQSRPTHKGRSASTNAGRWN